MARLPRITAPDHPHHITQRGNRRKQTFFTNSDYRAYIGMLAQCCHKYKVEIWAWCLMPNHVHLIAVPTDEKGLSLAIGETHRRYTKRINTRENWQGHLWQERFSSVPMDEFHLLAATRYIEMNPVAASLVKQPGEYRWSSARAHLRGRSDGLVTLRPLLDMVGDWRDFLQLSPESDSALFSKHERTGRPLGSDEFIANLEKTLGQSLRKKKPGPKKSSHKKQLSILSP